MTPRKPRYRPGWARTGLGKTATMAYQFFPQGVRQTLPALYSNEDNPDPIVQVKFFCPWSRWIWYATEGSPVDADGMADTREAEASPADYLFFGLVDGHEAELGYFSLSEFDTVRGPGGLKIERDIHWTPKPLSEVQKKVRRAA